MKSLYPLMLTGLLAACCALSTAAESPPPPASATVAAAADMTSACPPPVPGTTCTCEERRYTAVVPNDTSRSLLVAARQPADPSGWVALGKDCKWHRSPENIRGVFDTLQGRLFSAYLHARQTRPGMQGTLVVKLVIQPDGKVSDSEIVSSELGSPELEGKIRQMLMMTNFGAAQVDVFSGTHAMNFFFAGP